MKKNQNFGKLTKKNKNIENLYEKKLLKALIKKFLKIHQT